VAEAGEQGVKVPSGDGWGEAIEWVAVRERVEDFVDGTGNFGRLDPGELTGEGAPAGEAGIEVALRDRGAAGDGGFWAVVAAEFLVLQGGAAALLAAAQDVATFGSHGGPSGNSG
jgi:hypothetical protein